MALRKRRIHTLAALAAASTLLLTACGGDGGSESGSEGGLPPKDEALTIGIANEQPYGYMDKNGEATGFSPDVARAVLDNMGYSDYEFKVVEFGQLISGIQSRQFDLVAAGMYIDAERMQQVAFSDPDYCTTESLAVEKGNPEQIVDYSTFTENTDLTMAVASGTVEVGYAEDAGISDSQLKPYKGIDQMYDALEAGEVDAVTGTASTVAGQVKGRSGLESVEPFFPTKESGERTLPCGAYAFNLEDQEFRDAFNEELNKLREDGTTKKIITGYPGFADEDVELANSLTTADFQE